MVPRTARASRSDSNLGREALEISDVWCCSHSRIIGDFPLFLDPKIDAKWYHGNLEKWKNLPKTPKHFTLDKVF